MQINKICFFLIVYVSRETYTIRLFNSKLNLFSMFHVEHETKFYFRTIFLTIKNQ